MLHDGGIPVAVDHTPGAAVPNAARIVEVKYRADRLLPVVAPPEEKVPVEIEILVAAKALEPLGLLSEKPLHLFERGGGINDVHVTLELFTSSKARRSSSAV